MEIDKQLIGRRFARRYASYHHKAAVQKSMAARLARLVYKTLGSSRVRRAFEIGAGTGFLSHQLLRRYPEAEWHFNDLAPESAAWVKRISAASVFLSGDAERIEFPARLNLLASASAVQWFTDLPGFFGKARAALDGGGLLAIATFGPGNMREVREISGAGLDYPSAAALAALTRQAGLHPIKSEEWNDRLFFETADALLLHLRETGVSGLSRTVWTKSSLADFRRRCAARFSRPNGLIPLTYHPILLLAQKRE